MNHHCCASYLHHTSFHRYMSYANYYYYHYYTSCHCYTNCCYANCSTRHRSNFPNDYCSTMNCGLPMMMTNCACYWVGYMKNRHCCCAKCSGEYSGYARYFP